MTALALALPAAPAPSSAQTPDQLRSVSVLQFLIDTDGIGLFEPSGAYCVTDGRVEGSADAEVLRRLSARAGRIVGSEACVYEGSRLYVSGDRTPAMMLWARPGTQAELDRFRPSVELHDWSEEAVLIRAGLRTSELRVEYQCWLREGPEPAILRCDTRIVS